ncbi:patatin-like phospholipase family protein [Streptomyces chitinivorans]|uniref:Patatin-like phospholipase family protein n=1 Tax=Streptomyces chitinivorans TaxID=1257027 RepID=A0ABW7HNZ3_9ACTN|nr:patatin-like phospholipase family protein [Streptomyces chitinivorans]MDH2408323.1 patatin-like phospholipase family protein [Streptomyces chitinivorans]
MADRALVLGSGGHAGGAWQVGMLAGLAAAGVDLAGADTVIGTSAGAVVGARLAAGEHPEELHLRQSRAAGTGAGGAEPAAPEEAGPQARITPGAALGFLRAQLGRRTPEAVARRLGRMALRASTSSEEEVLEAIAALLPVREWPDALRVTAVDAHTGALGAFHRGSGADLLRAVAASCAMPGLWPPVALRGRWWIDGGVRSTTNADLARGHRRVVVLAPLPRAFGPGPRAERLAARLRAEGTEVALLVPDAAARRELGRNPLDTSRRAACARAGRAQAAAHARAVAGLWHG